MVASPFGGLGHRFLLLDHSIFPSDRLPTHFFSPPAFRAYGQIGALEKAQAPGPRLAVYHIAVDGTCLRNPWIAPMIIPFVGASDAPTRMER